MKGMKGVYPKYFRIKKLKYLKTFILPEDNIIIFTL